MPPGINLLLADPDDVQREMVRRVLNQADCQVMACDGGEAAVMAAMRSVPDVLITREDLGDGSGLALVSWVRSYEPLAHIPAIVVLSEASRAMEADAYDAGADLVLTPPLDMTLLVRMVQAVLRGRELAWGAMIEPVQRALRAAEAS